MAVWIDTVTGPATQTSGLRARTLNAWRMLANRKIVLWMPAFDLATIRQAIQVDGFISTIGPRENSEQALKEYCWKTVPWELFKQIQKHAKPWPEVMSSALSSMNAIDIEEVLLRLEDEGDGVESILRRCRGDVRNRVAEIQSAIDLPRRVTLNRRTILETKEGWYVVSKRSEQRELISDAILRIDFAIPHRRLGQIYYRGRVLYKGEEVPFLERKDRVEKDTLNWMQNLLYQREIGAIMFNPDWTRRIVTIAGRFQETKVLESVDTVGWNNERLCFVLPDYSIHLGGDVKPIEVAIFPEDTPGRQLKEPTVLSGEELDRPAKNEELARLFWATTACVLSNILAPTFNREPCGISLEGEGAIKVGMTVAESLGCTVQRLSDAKHVRRALDDEGTHQWPIVFQLTAMVQRRHRRQLVEGAGNHRNCIVALNWETGRVLGIKGGWHIISSNRRNVKVRSEVHDLARKLIPSYLRNLCARQLQLNDWQKSEEPLVQRVLKDLASFVDEFHGDPHAVLAAQDVLLPDRDGGPAEAFADLVGHFVKTGRLKIATENDSQGKPTLIESPENDGLYLSQQVLAKLLKDQPVEPPTYDDVVTALAVEGVLVEQREDGWVFEPEWFQKRQRLEAGVLPLQG